MEKKLFLKFFESKLILLTTNLQKIEQETNSITKKKVNIVLAKKITGIKSVIFINENT